ncbi:hypothetical protein TYRP_011229 [Tyrophagus putrescentiae]|nr:hypothetical protein TYRP_011229 [Tyrophagus putrescentiae]
MAALINLSSIVAASEGCAGSSPSERKDTEAALEATLKTALAASGHRLEQLLETGEVDIVELTRSTARLEERLAGARERLRALRAAMLQVKSCLVGELLKVDGGEKRAEFLAAYAEDRANRAALELLERVEKLAAMPEAVGRHLAAGEAHRAEEIVLKGLHQLEQGDEFGPLATEVEALKEVHSALLDYQRQLAANSPTSSSSSSPSSSDDNSPSSEESDKLAASVTRYITLPMQPATVSSSDEVSAAAAASAQSSDGGTNSTAATADGQTSAVPAASSASASALSTDYSKYFAKRTTVLQQASDHLEEVAKTALTSIINNTSIKFTSGGQN